MKDQLLAECAREPIHTPGAIQPFGALLAVSARDGTVVVASANAATFLRERPEGLIGQRLPEVLGEAAAAEVLAVRSDGWHANRDVAPSEAHGGALDLYVHKRDEVAIVELMPAPEHHGRVGDVHRLRAALAALDGATSVRALLREAVVAFRALTGYDRVMVYRFDADGHGEVVAEQRRDDLDPYLGLHYPASDIPEQARALMLEQPLRVIADVDYEPQAILPPDNPYTGRPLDLGRSLLRSVSPIHLQYLRNMGVASSATVALIRDGRLWGMLACHHARPRGVSPVVGEVSRLFADVLSHRIAAAEEAERSGHRVRLARVAQRLLDAIATEPSTSVALADHERDVLELTGADGAVVDLGAETVRLGDVPSDATVEHARRRLRGPGRLFVTDAFAPPDAADRETASGVLGLRVRGDEGGRVLWFRGEVLRTVSWGGNPHKPVEVAAGDGETRARLRPRASFAAWRETVRGRSRPWRSWEVDAASELGRALTEILDLRVARRQAVRDPLTGLPNRAAFGRRLDEGLQRLAREPQRGVGVLFVDVDRFKEINDTLGHLAGDQVLVTAAQRLHHAVRSTDTVARYAGDEFVILSEGIADACVLQELAERLLAQFREPIRLDGHDHVVTVSVGYATAAPGATAEEVLRRADGAMYDAKRSGRGVAAGDSAPDGAPLRFGRAASGGPAEPASDPAQGS